MTSNRTCLQLFADPGLVNRQLIDDLLKYKRLDGVDQALRIAGGGTLSRATSPPST